MSDARDTKPKSTVKKRKPAKNDESIDYALIDDDVDHHIDMNDERVHTKKKKKKQKIIHEAPVEDVDSGGEEPEELPPGHRGDKMANGSTIGKVSRGKGMGGITGFFKGLVRDKIHNEVEKQVGPIGAQIILGNKREHSNSKENSRELSSNAIRKSSKRDEEVNNSLREMEPLPVKSNMNADTKDSDHHERDNQLKQLELAQKYNVIHPNHPGVCFFHLVFKVMGVFVYMFLGFIVKGNLLNFLLNFTAIVFDFWITKNVSGRYLVGLRWWNDFDEESGEEEWYYESYDYNLNYSQIDNSVFWWGMACNTVFWAIMFIIKVLSLNFLWGLLTFVAMLLNGMNLWAYYRCSQSHKDKMFELMRNMHPN